MRTARTILIAVADDALRHSLAEQLELNREFAATACAGAGPAVELAARGGFDVILLDAALPGAAGGELCRRLRSAAPFATIVMLVGAGEEIAADLGADDYVTKPLRLGALLARLRADPQRGAAAGHGGLRIGPYTFRPAAKLLLDAAARRSVRLTEKETAILAYLYRAGAKATARDTLLGAVWGYQAGVATHTVETHVYRLRRKIERNPARAEILVTEPGGYRLVP
jgi:DNA-binding response OmpR family regulator